MSKVREAVAIEFSARLEQAQRLLDSVRGEVKAERERRREAEKMAEAAASSVRALASQRNLAWQEVQSLRARYEPEAAQINTREYKPR
jgi:hypothetical protein